MLLTYHDPQIVRHLELNCVIPEMYCIPWFITYFASRIEQVELVLRFWDRLMPKSDKEAADRTFIFFFAVALVVSNR